MATTGSKSIGNGAYAEALTLARGRIYLAAQMLGVTGSAVAYRIKQYPELAEIRDEARNQALDVAEDKLMDAINRGDPWAIKLFLTTVGKDRGYTEKVDIDSTVKHSGKIEHETSEVRSKLLDQLNGVAARLSVVPDDPFA